ncbi:pilus assembly protein [Arthrobacter silviterrae]|uniref:Pilus assembly protein n=1 Tax=Arthrobacter silviterrae TaxID=2026658 RepID=A0ABX0DKP0_9MICC|nr:TadE/TadG family type IV pilus assembly protein [Arthrobacter silviterrae]NGN84843.1 pilus assembly protein [Arthrobacter silviterrae]
MSRTRSEDGAAAVEFALLLPILIMLILGILEFGLAYNAQITVTNAAREGVRTMVIQNSPGAAKAAVETVSSTLAPAITDSEITITVSNGTATCTGGSTATVNIQYPFQFLTGFFGTGYTMTGKAAMRCGG